MRIRRAGCVLAVLGVLGVGATQAAWAQTEPENSFTYGTKHVTTTRRIDLPAATGACDAPASAPALVGESSVTLEPTVETITTFGPATVYTGEDLQTPYEVGDDETNFNTITTYETVVTQTYQGVDAGPSCPDPVTPAVAVVTTARLTG